MSSEERGGLLERKGLFDRGRQGGGLKWIHSVIEFCWKINFHLFVNLMHFVKVIFIF